MAKCERCGKSVGLLRAAVETRDTKICVNCCTRLGFNFREDKYLLATSNYKEISKGKSIYYALRKAKAEARYSFNVHYDDERIDKALERYQKFWTLSEDKYEGMTMRELKEPNLFGVKVYKYPPLDIDVELRESDEGIKVYLFDGSKEIFIGNPPKTKVRKIKQLMAEHDPYINAELTGGDYWILKDSGYVSDDWADDMKVRIELDWSDSIQLDDIV